MNKKLKLNELAVNSFITRT
ncbi:pinensin family lanthipeptide [Roseivirga sp. BDSF3-8]